MTSGILTSSIAWGGLATAEATAGVVTSLTVIGLPVGIISAGLGGVSGLIAGILANHCEKKKLKHVKMYSIPDTGVPMLDKEISTVLNDNVIRIQ